MLFLLLKWIVLTLIVVFAAWVIPGIEVDGYLSALIVAAVIALINVSLRPALNLITLPINILTLGLFTLVINALLLMFVSYLVPGFEVEGFWAAFWGALLMSIEVNNVRRIGTNTGKMFIVSKMPAFKKPS